MIVTNEDPPVGDDAGAQRPSKSQRKADAHALQSLGTKLIGLHPAQLDQVPLPDILREAVDTARRIRSHEARRRQLQYIGKLMRNVDAAPIRAKIDSWQSAAVESTTRQHLLERWRDRLLTEPDALAELAVAFPAADRQQVRTLIRNAQREREQNKPPRSYRALFQLLRDIIQP